MAAAALVVAAIVVGAPADAAVTADAAPRDLRPVQECADLAAWLAHLGGDCGAAGLTRGGDRRGRLCDAVAGGAGGAGACAARGPRTRRRAARPRGAPARQGATGARRLARDGGVHDRAYNNWGVVRPFLESLLAHARAGVVEARGAFGWPAGASSGSAHRTPAGAAPTRARVVRRRRAARRRRGGGAVRREFAAVAARASTTAVATASLDDLRAVMPYDVNELAFRYGLKCFSTAVKPWVFRLLFARGHARCLYFDPDIQFYADLDELVLRLHRVAILVTPHVTRPNPDDGKWQTDLQLARTGVYNFGFLGLSRAHEPVLDHFLAWWAARLRFEGHVDLEKGLHYDQQWGAFVASFYPPDAYHVLRDPRYNVAYWNLHYRGREIRVRPSDGAATYKGAPLIFVHFSGVATDAWDPDASLSPHQTRFRLGDFPNLAPLFRDYARATAGAARHRAACRYGLAAFDNGAPVPYGSAASRLARRRRPRARPRAPRAGPCGTFRLMSSRTDHRRGARRRNGRGSRGMVGFPRDYVDFHAGAGAAVRRGARRARPVESLRDGAGELALALAPETPPRRTADPRRLRRPRLLVPERRAPDARRLRRQHPGVPGRGRRARVLRALRRAHGVGPRAARESNFTAPPSISTSVGDCYAAPVEMGSCDPVARRPRGRPRRPTDLRAAAARPGLRAVGPEERGVVLLPRRARPELRERTRGARGARPRPASRLRRRRSARQRDGPRRLARRARTGAGRRVAALRAHHRLTLASPPRALTRRTLDWQLTGYVMTQPPRAGRGSSEPRMRIFL